MWLARKLHFIPVLFLGLSVVNGIRLLMMEPKPILSIHVLYYADRMCCTNQPILLSHSFMIRLPHSINSFHD
ncbi:hypothetical protein B0I35DRAFT_71078 [Stachybotrys elegans]|uniref:Uncharacterized protein n=1 Tax=Stachybotrys elegans TaxID=80388 RepID=A0A8K0WPY1_9HYPO|nr:hypothetical protein B0I35DRAFT_71078 [Stachybotrys elegans]